MRFFSDLAKASMLQRLKAAPVWELPVGSSVAKVVNEVAREVSQARGRGAAKRIMLALEGPPEALAQVLSEPRSLTSSHVPSFKAPEDALASAMAMSTPESASRIGAAISLLSSADAAYFCAHAFCHATWLLRYVAHSRSMIEPELALVRGLTPQRAVDALSHLPLALVPALGKAWEAAALDPLPARRGSAFEKSPLAPWAHDPGLEILGEALGAARALCQEDPIARAGLDALSRACADAPPAFSNALSKRAWQAAARGESAAAELAGRIDAHRQSRELGLAAPQGSSSRKTRSL